MANYYMGIALKASGKYDEAIYFLKSCLTILISMFQHCITWEGHI